MPQGDRIIIRKTYPQMFFGVLGIPIMHSVLLRLSGEASKLAGTGWQDGSQIKKCYDSPSGLFGDSMPRSMKGRLTQPLVRENGSHRSATWDEAMDRVVAAFRKSIEKNDPRNFGMFSCSKTTNELNYAAQKLVRSVMGSNNIDSCNRT
jgi:Molybdopterin oxidoreductase